MMRIVFTLLLLITIVNAFAQVTISPDSLDKKISSHFLQYRPELYKYSGLAVYGDTQTNFDQLQISEEISLFNEVKDSEIINNPTNNVFALCHNLLIHSPATGKDLLLLLNKPTSNYNILVQLMAELMFTEEYGERIALTNLESDNPDWSKVWAGYLSKNAIYESSVPQIEKVLQQTNDTEIKQDLIGALMYISNTGSINLIKQIIETTKDDKVQRAAIFAFTELSGYDGLSYLENIRTIGDKSKEEKTSSIKWLKEETSPENRYGTKVSNDIDFIIRSRDLKSPIMTWLDKEGLLNENIALNPVPLSQEKKNKLFNLLIESKGFGLEAVKAQLFKSITPPDIDKLLKLRKACTYSPNVFTAGRINTIGIMVRYLRKNRS